MEAFQSGSDVLFLLMGAVMVLAMHAGFAFLEVGTVRHKNQVNALVKIIGDFAVSTIAYFFIGYSVAYGVSFFEAAPALTEKNGYELVKFFFLLTFAAAIPAIVSGGIAERARFNPQLAATFLLVGFIYPFFEGITWNGNLGMQAWLEGSFGFGDNPNPVAALQPGLHKAPAGRQRAVAQFPVCDGLFQPGVHGSVLLALLVYDGFQS